MAGRLRLGSDKCRLQSAMGITFSRVQWGKLEDLGIMVQSSGQLDMHGVYYNPTWTR